MGGGGYWGSKRIPGRAGNRLERLCKEMGRKRDWGKLSGAD
jgi:hypothetical protein